MHRLVPLIPAVVIIAVGSVASTQGASVAAAKVAPQGSSWS